MENLLNFLLDITGDLIEVLGSLGDISFIKNIDFKWEVVYLQFYYLIFFMIEVFIYLFIILKFEFFY